MYKPMHGWLFLAPALIFILVFSIIPSFIAFGLSFTEYNVFTPVKWVGLQNYREVLQDQEFWKTLKNTLTSWPPCRGLRQAWSTGACRGSTPTGLFTTSRSWFL